MKLELTPATQLALNRARQMAALDRSSQVEPRHLLQGLLAEEEGKGVALLTQSGIDWSKLQPHLGLPIAEPIDDADAPSILHPTSQRILQCAGELTRLHGDEGSVPTDHVLLALMTSIPELRTELQGFGMDFDKLQRAIVGETETLPLAEPLLLEVPAEQVQTARILDACANRSREALRVMEDYMRFVRNDVFLSQQCKQLRHDLVMALELLPSTLLLNARDTQHDVGTTISTEQEWQRSSLQDVLQTNAKRLQEGLRSLEEYGKVINILFAQQVEKIRYQCYTLERAILIGLTAQERLEDAQLYVLVTDAHCRYSLIGTVKEAILGGAHIIQLREKNLDDRTLVSLARDVRQVTRGSGTLFIINDRPDIALLAEADGVHLGQEDLSVHDARRLLGPEALIGVSTHSLDQVRQAVLDGASYLGVGPTFPTPSKHFELFPGLDFVRQAIADTSLPTFVIGGIQLENIAQVRSAGAHRIAVSHALCSAEDPRHAASALLTALKKS